MTGPPLFEPDPSGGDDESPTEGSVLWESAALHFPVFGDDVSRRERADLLEDHIERTAHMRGRLAEVRLKANVELKIAKDEFDRLEVATPGKTSLQEARTRARPDLAQKINDAKWTIQRCTEEMDRHGGSEYDSASRAYTILSGS